MPLHGISHIGLSTLDLDATRTFYERVLGFRLVTIEQIDLEEFLWLCRVLNNARTVRVMKKVAVSSINCPRHSREKSSASVSWIIPVLPITHPTHQNRGISISPISSIACPIFSIKNSKIFLQNFGLSKSRRAR